MTLGLSRRAGVVLLAGILLAGNLAFFFWYRATAQIRREGMEGKRVALTRDVEAREREAARLAGQRGRLSQVSSAIDEFYGKRVGSRRETLAPVVLEIHTLLSRAGISPAQTTYATKPVTNLPLSEMTVNFTFRNDYNRFKQLLASIETDRKWIVVRDVGLNRDPDIPGSVQVRLVLATYFASDETGETPRSALAEVRR
jgi:hypothetical protein